MKTTIFRITLISSVTALLLAAVSLPPNALHRTSPESPFRVESSAFSSSRWQNTPLGFVENVGQFDERARFLMRAGNQTIWLAEDAIWLTISSPPLPSRFSAPRERGSPELHSPSPPSSVTPGKGVHLKLSFPDANPHPRLEPFDRLETRANYYLSNDPAHWRSSVPIWGGVRLVDLYPGVDLEMTGQNGYWSWQFVTRHSSFDMRNLRLRIEGAEALTREGSSLRLATAAGEHSLPLPSLNLPTPVARPIIQTLQPGVFEITSPFASSRDYPQTSVVRTPPYIPESADDLRFGTYLGGSNWDWATALSLDGEGNVIVTGVTESSDFPITPGAFDPDYDGYYDVFVSKLSADGRSLLFSTFLGGTGGDEGHALALDSAGNILVSGATASPEFPTTEGAYDTTHNGVWDIFVLRLAADGGSLGYSTLVGGEAEEWIITMAVDSENQVAIAGGTYSPNFPTTTGAYDTEFNGVQDAYVFELQADGSALTYSTFFGGSSWDGGYALVLDEAGNALVTGVTESEDFPTTPGAFDTEFNGKDDAFVFKLAADGSSLIYSTFIGGSEIDAGRALALDSEGNVVLTGGAQSADFPTTEGAHDTTHNGEGDVFVLKLAADGSTLLFSTYVGGDSLDWGYSLALNEDEGIVVAGSTWSADFPTNIGAYDTDHNGGFDVFVFTLTTDGSGLGYSTYVGGSNDDLGSALALDNAGGILVVGQTNSWTFPVTLGSYDLEFNGGVDAYIFRLAPGPQIWFQEDDPMITYTGKWRPRTCPQCNGGALEVVSEKGANAAFTFKGTGVKWYMTKADSLGKATVYLDDVAIEMVDLYSPVYQYQVIWESDTLPAGIHTLRLNFTKRKNPASSGYAIDLDMFEVIP